MSETTFIRYRRGAAVFRLHCEACGTRGELAVTERERNRLVACPGGCGAHFIQRRGRGFFAVPTLELAIEPKRKGIPSIVVGPDSRVGPARNARGITGRLRSTERTRMVAIPAKLL